MARAGWVGYSTLLRTSCPSRSAWQNHYGWSLAWFRGTHDQKSCKQDPSQEHLCTFSMAKGTLIQNHLDDFNSVIIDLESLDAKLEDED